LAGDGGDAFVALLGELGGDELPFGAFAGLEELFEAVDVVLVPGEGLGGLVGELVVAQTGGVLGVEFGDLGNLAPALVLLLAEAQDQRVLFGRDVIVAVGGGRLAHHCRWVRERELRAHRWLQLLVWPASDRRRRRRRRWRWLRRGARRRSGQLGVLVARRRAAAAMAAAVVVLEMHGHDVLERGLGRRGGEDGRDGEGRGGGGRMRRGRVRRGVRAGIVIRREAHIYMPGVYARVRGGRKLYSFVFICTWKNK
jgi:hypothetical protein